MLDGLQNLFADPALLAANIVIMVVAITLHELGHAASAHWCGDDTAKKRGRLTLDPLKHLDPLGSLLIVVAGFGWGKPVPVNPQNFRRPRRDDLLVSFAGPAANIVQAVAFGTGLRIFAATGWHIPHLIEAFFEAGLLINVLLAVFNLIPVGPLDGAHILKGLLPPKSAVGYARFNHRYGWVVLLLVVVTGAASYVFNPAYNIARRVLVGT